MSDINIFVTSSLTSSERRISPQWDLHYLKQKLELVTGIAPASQTIWYYSSGTNDSKIIIDSSEYNEASDKTRYVSELGITSQGRLHVMDADPDSSLKELDEEENVPEYKISDEDYAKRENTVLNWKKQNKLGRFDPNYDEEKSGVLKENALAASAIKSGDRCRVINIQGERRGTVRYVGKIDILDKGENVWVGVEFDEPLGRNDGSISGKKIFSSKPNHGSFVKPKQVEVGDFPEIDPFEDDDEL